MKGGSSYSSRNILSCEMQILRSPVMKSYELLNPRGPNFLLSSITPWNKHNENNNDLNSSVCKNKKFVEIKEFTAWLLKLKIKLKESVKYYQTTAKTILTKLSNTFPNLNFIPLFKKSSYLEKVKKKCLKQTNNFW